MSIASEITRLQTAKAAITSAIEGHGVTVPSGTTYSGFAALIADIQGGGASSLEDIASGKLDYTTQATIAKGTYISGLDILRGVSGGQPIATLGSLSPGVLVAFEDPLFVGKMPYYVLGEMHKTGCVTLHRSKTFTAPGIVVQNSTVAYPESTHGQHLDSTFYGAFATAIKNLIQQVPVVSRLHSNTTDVTATNMYVFALSTLELAGITTYGVEGQAIPWLTSSAANRIRQNQSTDAAHAYIGRTGVYVGANNNTQARGIGESGAETQFSANGPCYCPALAMLATQPVIYNATEGYYEIALGTEIDFVARFGSLDLCPTQIAVNFELLGDGAQLLSCQVCNNVNDVSPTWETYTRNTIHTFANQTKTADQWGYGCRIAAQSANGVVECTAPYFMGVPV